MNGPISIFVASASVLLASATAPAMASPAEVTVSDDGCRVSLRGEDRRDHVRSRRHSTGREAGRRSASSARSAVRLSSGSHGRTGSSVAVATSSNGRGRSATVTQTNNGCSVVIDEELRKGAPR